MSFERGDLVWANFSPQRGHEQSGRRPALVISPSGYNARSNTILVCPITSNVSPWPWKVRLPEDGEISGAVLVDQLKSIDAGARNVVDAGQAVEAALLDDVLARLATLVA